MFCKNCGNEMDDRAVVCVKCGCMTEEGVLVKSKSDMSSYGIRENSTNSTYRPAGLCACIKVLSILSCVFLGFLIIPLCWTIPMTVVLFCSLGDGSKISVGFKICYLLFCNLIVGIILLCMDN